jgi:hypothetical protein
MINFQIPIMRKRRGYSPSLVSAVAAASMVEGTTAVVDGATVAFVLQLCKKEKEKVRLNLGEGRGSCVLLTLVPICTSPARTLSLSMNALHLSWWTKMDCRHLS